MSMSWLVVFVVFGVNFTLWGLVGLVRLLAVVAARLRRRRPAGGGLAAGAPDAAGVDVGATEARPFTVRDVAVLIPAHNEELVIESTIRAIARLVPLTNVFVVSDGSVDDTVARAERCGATVLELPVAGGKARALEAGLTSFELAARFALVLLLDADSELDDRYFEAALPPFADPGVACVAGYATTVWHPREMSIGAQVLAAHRERIYATSQLFVKYGQTAKHTNVTPIVPGFASLYRSRVLEEIHVAAPRLVIEDFNMTFEVHHRHLGRVAFTPGARAYTQDPHRLADYNRQVRRWTLGFWQTVRRHGLWFSRFCAALLLTMAELVLSSLLLVWTTVALLMLAASDAIGRAATTAPVYGPVSRFVAHHSSLRLVAVIWLSDYALTIVVAAIQRRPRYLLLGLFFLPLRLVDSMATLSAIPRAWLVTSTGRWVSPARQAVGGPVPAVVLAPGPSAGGAVADTPAGVGST